MPRVHLIGAGAIGSVIAHQLRAAGTDVTVLVRRQMAARGTIELHEPQRGDRVSTESVNIEAINGSSFGPIDRLVVATKSFAVASALQSVQARLTRESAIVLVHNGLVVEPLDTVLGNGSRENVFTGIWQSGSFQKTPLPAAETRWNAPAPFLIGPLLPQAQPSEQAGSLLDLLASVKSLQADLVDHLTIHRRQRVKLAVNCVINPLTGLMNVRNGTLTVAEDITHDICREIAAVYEAERIAEGAPVEPAFQADALANAVFDVMKITASNYASTLQDVRKNARTEISHINGALRLMHVAFELTADRCHLHFGPQIRRTYASQ